MGYPIGICTNEVSCAECQYGPQSCHCHQKSAKMRILLYFALASTRLVLARIAIRQETPNGPWQNVPTSQPKPDNTYHNGQPQLNTEPPVVPDAVDPMFAAHPIDIPFGRLHNGSLKYFPEGQLNTASSITDQWAPGTNDFANQSACGIPDSAFFISKVAIHPYFLKYAPDGLGLSSMFLFFLLQTIKS